MSTENYVGEPLVPLRRKKTRMRYRVTVIGGGSWATAIIKILSTNLEHITWWVREPEIEEGVNKFGHNPLYLSSVLINPKEVKITTNIVKAVAKADYIVVVTPSAFLHSTLAAIPKSKLQKKKIITAVKGIIPETMQLITDYLKSEFNISASNLAMITGASHAEEIAQEKFTYLTAASENADLSEIVAKFFTNRYVRTSTSDDLMGVEMAVVLKNIYALGAGIYAGLGYGDNFTAAFIANCVKEMKYFVDFTYPNENRALTNSSYLGDLLVTAYSQYSRNRLFGKIIGYGLSVKIAQMEMKMVSEGYYACRCVHELNKKYNANIPIVETIYGILYENHSAQNEMRRLAEYFI